MIVKELYLCRSGKRESIEACDVKESHGLIGDDFSGEGPRQISFCAEDATRDGGLCGPRYQANLVIEGLELDALDTGDLLTVGSAVLRISIKGKKCFPECPIVQSGTVCYLKTHCGFATVEQAGTISVGDAVMVEKAQ